MSSPAPGKTTRRPSQMLQLEEFLPYRLNVVTQAVSQALARLYSEQFGLSVPEWRIMAALGEYTCKNGSSAPGITARDIAKSSRMGKVMVSRAAVDLIDRKIVLRRANREDKREAFLRLSAKGLAMYADIVPKALAFQAKLEAGISDSDARAFDRVIRQLLQRADQADELLSTQAATTLRLNTDRMKESIP